MPGQAWAGRIAEGVLALYIMNLGIPLRRYLLVFGYIKLGTPDGMGKGPQRLD
jgi:hypothetical protein